MATSVFKGNVRVGQISARFMSDFSNVDPDLVIASYADGNGGNAQSSHDAVAPGGSGQVGVNAAAPGLLEVLVVTGQDSDSGRLQVVREGTTLDNEAIQGPVRWLYMVIE